MNAAEEAGLRELAAELAGAEQSAWQPRCIARAFATPGEGELVLTMQGWIDLDRANSPLLEGRLPDSEEELGAAIDAFRCGPIDLAADEAMGLGLMMLEAIEEAFGLSLPMTQPGDGDHLSMSAGFGDWLPILAALIAQLGLSRGDALATPVGQVFALLAADKRNRGWEPSRATYAQRDVLRKGDARG